MKMNKFDHARLSRWPREIVPNVVASFSVSPHFVPGRCNIVELYFRGVCNVLLAQDRVV